MVTTRSKNFILCEESFLETNREEVRCGEIGPEVARGEAEGTKGPISPI